MNRLLYSPIIMTKNDKIGKYTLKVKLFLFDEIKIEESRRGETRI